MLPLDTVTHSLPMFFIFIFFEIGFFQIISEFAFRFSKLIDASFHKSSILE